MPAKMTINDTNGCIDPEQNRGDWISGAAREDIISILDNAPYGIVINNSQSDGKVLYINRTSYNLIGYMVSEIPTGRIAQNKFSKDQNHQQEMHRYEDSLRKTGKAFGTKKAITKDGQLKYFDVRTVLLPSGSVVSMFDDVTRRETAENELRENELKFRTLFDQSPDAVLLFSDGHIIDCNASAERLLRAQDRKLILNRTLDQLSPCKQRDGRSSTKRAQELFSSAIKNKSLRFEWQLECFDGHIFPVESTATMIQLYGKTLLYVILRDITAWKHAEQSLLEAQERLEDRVNERTSKLKDVNRQLIQEIRRRKAIERELEKSREELRLLSEHLQLAREEERAHIAREVHDELGQFLTALKIDVTCIGKSAPPCPEDLLNMEKRIDNAIVSVRHLCSELRPPVLEHFGLPAAIECYLEDFQKRTGIKCFKAVDPYIPIKDRQLQLMLFRIFQEAMTNILRHAEATRADVELKIVSKTLTLSVKDNGTGITKRRMENPHSFGIKGIRERVRYWGGDTFFDGSPNEGTAMTVTIPQNAVPSSRQQRFI